MTWIVLIAAVASLFWGAAFVRFAGVWGCCVAVLIVGTVFGHPFFHVSMATLDRALLGMTCGLYFGVWRMRRHEPKRWDWNDTLLLAFIATLGASVFSHDWRMNGMASLSRWVFFFVCPTLMYWMARQTAIRPSTIVTTFAALALFGVYVSLTAVAEKTGQHWAVFPRYIADPKFAEFLGRGRGPLLNPSGNGVLLALTMTCSLLAGPHLRMMGKGAVASALPVFLAGVYSTLTRCAWLGAAGSLMIVAAATIPRRWRVPVIAMTVVGAMCVVAWKWDSLVAFKRDKNVSVAEMKDSASLRPLLAMVAWKMFQDYPMLGCGLGRYLEVAPDYVNDRTVDMPIAKVRPYVQHNIFLSLLTETGLVGATLFTILLVRWSLAAWRLWRSVHAPLALRQIGLLFLAFLAAYLANGMFQDVLIMPMVNMYLFFLAGAVRSALASPSPAPYFDPRMISASRAMTPRPA